MSQRTDRVVLAQCTSRKRAEESEAKYLYDESRYFRKQRRYAEHYGDCWYIQSAKHGLVTPETVIENYNKRPKDIDNIDAWACEIVNDLAERHRPANTVVEILGGCKYADPIRPLLERRGFAVVEPLDGLRIGPRERKLVEMVA